MLLFDLGKTPDLPASNPKQFTYSTLFMKLAEMSAFLLLLGGKSNWRVFDKAFANAIKQTLNFMKIYNILIAALHQDLLSRLNILMQLIFVLKDNYEHRKYG